ncbi:MULTISPECIES: hypothetical protein [Pseudomonas]|uniref:hypothetical protein n=1 Tax=Pseudomonas TaxID=286 RepID=UPI0015E41338|nr:MULTISPECIES: hypothetical protein [Pseudomonas]MBA1242198.1 hypothetical protein [Pseudomonas japonica]MBA1288511.1 hypothetical protein [Pseudomonas japonica]
MPLPALFLNAVFCTSEAHTTCMPPQFVWVAETFVREDKRVEQCAEKAAELNAKREDLSVLYRCDTKKGV